MRSSVVTSQPYSRPPITEAVIEIRFKGQIDEKLLAKANKAFARFYPDSSIIPNVMLKINPVPSGSSGFVDTAVVNHYRRATGHEHEIMVLTPQSVIISQTPPYPGWSAFCQRLERDWSLWKKTAGIHQIARLGLRYLNRIDIPVPLDGVTQEDKYLNFFLNSPKELGLFYGYGAQAVLLTNSSLSGTITINSGLVSPPPVPYHTSIMLDIDVGKDINSLPKDEEIVELLSSMRLEKNRVFETLITDKARDMFK